MNKVLFPFLKGVFGINEKVHRMDLFLMQQCLTSLPFYRICKSRLILINVLLKYGSLSIDFFYSRTLPLRHMARTFKCLTDLQNSISKVHS